MTISLLDSTAINTMVADITTAKSPEEAAKIFKREVSYGFAQLIADALAKTVAETANHSSIASNNAIGGWTDFIGGNQMMMSWDTPFKNGGLMLPLVQFSDVATSDEFKADEVPSIKGNWSVSVGVGGSF